MRQTASLMSLPNQDYWRTVGKDAARAALDALCDALDIPVPSETGPAMELLDHIREANKAAAEVAREYSHSLRVYDLRDAPRAAPASPTTVPAAASDTSVSATASQSLSSCLAQRCAASGTDGWTAKSETNLAHARRAAPRRLSAFNTCLSMSWNHAMRGFAVAHYFARFLC